MRPQHTAASTAAGPAQRLGGSDGAATNDAAGRREQALRAAAQRGIPSHAPKPPASETKRPRAPDFIIDHDDDDAPPPPKRRRATDVVDLAGSSGDEAPKRPAEDVVDLCALSSGDEAEVPEEPALLPSPSDENRTTDWRVGAHVQDVDDSTVRGVIVDCPPSWKEVATTSGSLVIVRPAQLTRTTLTDEEAARCVRPAAKKDHVQARIDGAIRFSHGGREFKNRYTCADGTELRQFEVFATHVRCALCGNAHSWSLERDCAALVDKVKRHCGQLKGGPAAAVRQHLDRLVQSAGAPPTTEASTTPAPAPAASVQPPPQPQNEAAQDALEASGGEPRPTFTNMIDRFKAVLSEAEAEAPPPAPGQMVQCDRCGKWHELPGNVDGDALPEQWFCADNHWDPWESFCEAGSTDAWTAEDATIMDALFMAPRPPARVPAWQDPVPPQWYDTLSGIYK